MYFLLVRPSVARSGIIFANQRLNDENTRIMVARSASERCVRVERRQTIMGRKRKSRGSEGWKSQRYETVVRVSVENGVGRGCGASASGGLEAARTRWWGSMRPCARASTLDRWSVVAARSPSARSVRTYYPNFVYYSVSSWSTIEPDEGQNKRNHWPTDHWLNTKIQENKKKDRTERISQDEICRSTMTSVHPNDSSSRVWSSN